MLLWESLKWFIKLWLCITYKRSSTTYILILAFLAKRNTVMLVSGFPMGIYYTYEIIHPTATGLKWVQNTQCRTVFIYFIQYFFLIFSGSLTFLNNFLSSMVLLDFEDVDCGTMTVFTSLCKWKTKLWFQCMKGLATESWIVPIVQRNTGWEDKSHPLTIFLLGISPRTGRGRRTVPCLTA